VLNRHARLEVEHDSQAESESGSGSGSGAVCEARGVSARQEQRAVMEEEVDLYEVEALTGQSRAWGLMSLFGNIRGSWLAKVKMVDRSSEEGVSCNWQK